MTWYFQELLSLRKVYTQKDYESGRAHITANYTQSVLPGYKILYLIVHHENNRLYLWEH